MISPNCPFCKFSNELKQLIIHEFKHSIWVVGEHQFFPSYTMLILKDHQREMSQLPKNIQQEFFNEIMEASNIIQTVFNPFKMNYASLGNQVEHLHWHLFPRYKEENDFKMHPWLNQHEFNKYKTTPTQVQNLINKIKPHIK